MSTRERLIEILENQIDLGQVKAPKPPPRQKFVEYLLSPRVGSPHFVRPSQHRLMLEDMYRTETFRTALLLNVRRHMTVLEIGVGTGVLSACAAKFGAAHVYGIEATAIGDMARSVFAHNHLESQVTLLRGHSTQVELPKRADLLVTETLGHLAFDEGILETCYDARQRLLTPEAIMLPGSFELLVAPVQVPAFGDERNFWAGDRYGLSFAPAQAALYNTIYLTRFADDAPLGDYRRVVQRTLGEAPNYPLVGEVNIPIKRAGSLDGLALTFNAQLASVTLYGKSAHSWQDVFLPFEHPVPVRAGETVIASVRFDAPDATGQFGARWEVWVQGDPRQAMGEARCTG